MNTSVQSIARAPAWKLLSTSAALRTARGGWTRMSVTFDPATGRLSGPEVTESRRTVGQLAGWFADEATRTAMEPETVIYRVESYMPLPEGHLGAVCIATTYL